MVLVAIDDRQWRSVHRPSPRLRWIGRMASPLGPSNSTSSTSRSRVLLRASSPYHLGHDVSQSMIVARSTHGLHLLHDVRAQHHRPLLADALDRPRISSSWLGSRPLVGSSRIEHAAARGSCALRAAPPAAGNRGSTDRYFLCCSRSRPTVPIISFTRASTFFNLKMRATKSGTRATCPCRADCAPAGSPRCGARPCWPRGCRNRTPPLHLK